MTISNVVLVGSVVGNAVLNMVAVVRPPEITTLGLVILANIISAWLIRAAWLRASRKQAAAFIESGPTLSIILGEYAERHASHEDRPR